MCWEELGRKSKALSRREGVTLFMVLLGAYRALLSRYSGAEEVVVGTPVAGRTRMETEGLIGFFVNTLVLRENVRGERSFREVLEGVRRVCLGGYEHQELPFEKLVEELQPERDLSHSPIVQVLFNLLNVQTAPTIRPVELPQMSLTPLKATGTTAKFDLNLAMVETRGEIRADLEFNSDLFDESTIRHMVANLQDLLQRIVTDPDQSLSALTKRIPKRKLSIAVASTFTSEPIEESLAVWMELFGIPTEVKFAPYNQVFQQLFEPSSLFATNDGGVNIMLLRLEDWVQSDALRDDHPGAQAERSLGELLDALGSRIERSSAYYLVGLCPLSEAAMNPQLNELQKRMESLLAERLKHLPGAYYLNLTGLASRYEVEESYDSYADQLGHIPFTQQFFAALGTHLARQIYALLNGSYKVIALDCDNTLWKGICGEDGSGGIQVAEPFQALQNFMKRQLEGGRLLCLCSKNNEEDVFEAFEQHPEMPLTLDHFTSRRINWRTKSENLRELADELQLSLDSFIFLDDNTLECAEVRARCPEVLTLQLPSEAEAIPSFLEHLWVFDQLKVTDEDKRRSTLYRQNHAREQLRREMPTIKDFLGGLELHISITPLVLSQSERVSQLTERTTQFNVTNSRRSASEIERLGQDERKECWVVQVRDRFGDYGLVGVMIFETQAETLKVDTFLLSCRALGRSVEDTMLVKLCELAVARNCRRVSIPFHQTARNIPALNFLNRALRQTAQMHPIDSVYNFDAQAVLRCEKLLRTTYGYFFEQEDEGRNGKHAKVSGAGFDDGLESQAASALSLTTQHQTIGYALTTEEKSGLLNRIATEFRSAEQILSAIHTHRARKQPRRKLEYVAPGTPIEEILVALWSEVLGQDRIGVHDNFFELGGHSLMATILLSHMSSALQVELPLRTLFERPTVAELAELVAEIHMQQVDLQEMAQLLETLTEMSEEETRRRLSELE